MLGEARAATYTDEIDAIPFCGTYNECSGFTSNG
jgi:hypothetical protein